MSGPPANRASLPPLPVSGRRTFLKTIAAGAGAALVGGGSLTLGGSQVARAAVPRADGPPGGAFPNGVVSSVAAHDTVVLWTRVVRPTDGADVDVDWEIATDATFTNIVAADRVAARDESGHTVKVSVSSLDVNTWFFYRFRAAGTYSGIGRTRTAPAPGTIPERLRLAFCSCQHYETGYYTAWRGIANEDIDFVLHLGDYIYESAGEGSVRKDSIGTSHTLDQYRRKYRLYRSDVDLQAAHANFPLVPIWDDHEVRDDYDRTIDPARMAAAYQAWFEHMPVISPDGEGTTRTYRTLQWGDLAELFLLDTRQYRDPAAGVAQFTLDPNNPMVRPGRTILGARQRDWLKKGLVDTGAVWRLVGNQVMILPWRVLDFDEPRLRRLKPDLVRNAGLYLNGDSWDGFQHERHEVLSHLDANDVRDVVFLTGDVHSFFAGDVRADFDRPKTKPVGAEFVGGAISSYFMDDMPDLARGIQDMFRSAFKEIAYVEVLHKGYGILDVTPEQVICELRFVDARDFYAEPYTAARFRMRRGHSGIERLPA